MDGKKNGGIIVSSSSRSATGYTYDNAGNRISKTNYLNNATENYTYDAIYQLTQVEQGLTTTESYSYDAVGNRLSSKEECQGECDKASKAASKLFSGTLKATQNRENDQ